MEFKDEQLRQSDNLAMAYDAWVQNERRWLLHSDRLSWKNRNGTAYLYRVRDRKGRGHSLGPRAPELQRWADEYDEARAEIKSQRSTLGQRLDEVARICRALRMPALDSTAGSVLRQADIMDLLGTVLMTVGTNAMLAYACYARRILPPEMAATQDFDMAWCGEKPSEVLNISNTPPGPVMSLLKSVDSTFTVNSERPFQARNASAFEVELLVAPSRAQYLPPAEGLRPVPTMPEQEWLLMGNPVSEVVVTRNAHAARIVAPDPRWYALHKLWMSRKLGRNPNKKPKDEKQGRLLWDFARDGAFPFHPLDEEFLASVPEELSEVLPRSAS